MSALLQLSGHEVRHPFAGSLARFSLSIRLAEGKLYPMRVLSHSCIRFAEFAMRGAVPVCGRGHVVG